MSVFSHPDDNAVTKDDLSTNIPIGGFDSDRPTSRQVRQNGEDKEHGTNSMKDFKKQLVIDESFIDGKHTIIIVAYF